MRSANRVEPASVDKRTDESHAKASVKELRAVVEEIRELGLDLPELDEMLLESVEAIEGLSDVNLVPSFADAAKIAVEGLQIGQGVISSHRAASNAVEKAEHLIKNEYENQGDIHGNVFQHLILSPSLDLLKESRQYLDCGDFERVHAILQDLRALPGKVRKECQENAEIYRYCETILEDMRKGGVTTQEVEDILRISRTAFLNGRFERVKELAEVIEEKAIHLREKHRSALQALKRAKRAGIMIEKINARSLETEESMVEACVSMKEGDYDRCIELSDRATATATRVRRRYKKLVLRIKALRRDMKRKGSNLPDDLAEMLARAERELKRGNHQGSQAEVEIASLMLNQFEPSV
jgi:hypothetical protein